LAVFWFIAGVLFTIACFAAMRPWLRAKFPWQVGVGAGVMLALAAGLYWQLGRPDLIAQPSITQPSIAQPAVSAGNLSGAFSNAARAASGFSVAQGSGAGSMSAATSSLEARLAKGGGSADDWELLAKSYEFLGRAADANKARLRQLPPATADAAGLAPPAALLTPALPAPPLPSDAVQWLAKADRARRERKMTDAAAIYAQLAARGQMNADSWADYADTLATVQSGKLGGEPETYIARSLALDPKHPKALWLKASADEEAGRFTDAVETWQKLEAVLPANSADAGIVASNLQKDAKLAAEPRNGTAPSSVSVRVSGEVSLAGALSAKASSGATLFIVAKSVDSPGAPVAVLRASVDSWPVKFTLDDSQSMLPGRNLSSAGRVTIEARISQHGQPLPAPGDLQGSSGVINPADHVALKILIDRTIT
jgi:cytochrome c-type biogenesis protein CcmH/NrfG